MSDEQAPGIGDWVHYVNGERHVPALVTDPAFPVFGADVAQALTVFPVNAPPFTTIAAQDSTGAPGTWHWPEHMILLQSEGSNEETDQNPDREAPIGEHSPGSLRPPG